MFIGVEDVTQSTADDGEIRVTLGDSRLPEGFAPDTAVWTSGGFISRPMDPDAAGAAQGLYVNDGNKRRVVAWRDNRIASKAGSLEPGESAIVCDRDGRVMVKSSNNSVTLVTVNGQDGDTTMLVSLRGDEGKITLMCGPSSIELTKDGIAFITPGASMLLDADGLSVCGAHTALNTTTGNLGVITPVLAPQPPIQGVQYGPALGVPSTSWAVKP